MHTQKGGPIICSLASTQEAPGFLNAGTYTRQKKEKKKTRALEEESRKSGTPSGDGFFSPFLIASLGITQNPEIPFNNKSCTVRHVDVGPYAKFIIHHSPFPSNIDYFSFTARNNLTVLYLSSPT